MTRSRTIAAVAAAIVAALVALVILVGAPRIAGLLVPPASPATDEPTTLRAGLMVLDHPASWRTYHYDVTSSFQSVLAYVGSAEVRDPCVRTANSIACGQADELAPNTIVVTISNWGFPGRSILDPRDRAVAVRVGGLPGWRMVDELNRGAGADRSISWQFARPDSITNWYELRADLRGPDVAALSAQLEAVVASIRWDPPLAPLDRSALGQARALASLGRYLASAARDDSTWACIPRAIGAQEAVITREPSGPPLSEPLSVRCSTAIRPTDLERWEATLRIDWGLAPGEARGHWVTRLYGRDDEGSWEGTTTQSDPFPGS